MYRLVPLPIDSEPQPNVWSAVASFGVLIVLSLIGVAGALAIGYYLPGTSAKAYWFISRSSGVVAYILITLGVLWGLVQSGSLFRSRISPLLALGMHSYLNWLGLGLAGLHGLILTGDGYINIDLPRVFTPFISSYRPIPVGLGIIAFYLMLLLSLSFYARSYLGQKSFRLLHYASFGVFVMVTLHSLLAGTDTGSLWWLYSLSLVAVVALTTLRIVSVRRAKKQQAVRLRANVTAERSTNVRSRPSAQPRPLTSRLR